MSAWRGRTEMRILVVDDDVATRELLVRSFGRAGYGVAAVASSREAETLVAGEHFDILVVDVMLPDGSGVDLCRVLRQRSVKTPVLLLTARGAVGDRVQGLDAGADDYMPKPFAVSELLARVRALGRRGPALRDEVIVVGGVEIDLGGRRVSLGGKSVAMTARELAILETLARNPRQIVSRDQIMESVWGTVSDAKANTLEVLMARIRRKLGGPQAPIRTVRNVGYALEGP
jgi:DNA-binding response OmpR family regulator